MLAELHRYVELLVFLAGTFLYGFLARAVLRRRRVLPGNWPLRLLLVCLTLWYGLTLADELLDLLFGQPPWLALPGTVLDLVRASAWLFSFPLLVQTLDRIELREGLRAPDSPRRLLPLLTWATLIPFALPALRFASSGEPLLAEAARRAYPWVVLQASITLPIAAVLAWRLARRVVDGRLAKFLRRLAGVAILMLGILAWGALVDPWAPDARGLARGVRTLLLAGLLLPGGLFAFFVQRYNLLRLSFSHRALRHFSVVLVLVALVMASGPMLGEDLRVVRRFVAWGLGLALLLGFAWAPLVDRLTARSTALRRWLGKSVTPPELERLMEGIEDPAGGEPAVFQECAAAIGHWLGTEAFFVRSPEEDPEMEPFWRFCAVPEAVRVDRLDPPDERLAALLGRRDLHAVFPLRVAGELEALLALSATATGGGYSSGELDGVRLALRQLAAVLALRRVASERLAAERRALDDERLRVLGLVAASLAHEVKNPLSSMKALIQAVREDLVAETAKTAKTARLDDCVADLEVVLEQIDRLDQTTREILGMARPRRGATAELAPLLRSIVYVLRAEAKKRGVELQDEIADVGTAAGSEAAWQTVLFNLALNAVEHTPDGGAARLRLAREGDRVVFETRNPGAEITEGALDDTALERIFEPFVSDGGTGLGLALVARRVEELGGTVSARRCEDGVCFRVELEVEP